MKDWYHVNLPHNNCSVFGPRGQFGAVIGELAEPDFIAVFCENLLSVARKLFPTNTQTHVHGSKSRPSCQQTGELCLT